MHKKFEINQTKIKGGCESGRKVVTHNSKSDLPLVEMIYKISVKCHETACCMSQKFTAADITFKSFCPFFIFFSIKLHTHKQSRRKWGIMVQHSCTCVLYVLDVRDLRAETPKNVSQFFLDWYNVRQMNIMNLSSLASGRHKTIFNLPYYSTAAASHKSDLD